MKKFNYFLPISLFLLFTSGAGGQDLSPEVVLMEIAGEEITDRQYRLFLRTMAEELKSLRPDLPTNQEVLESVGVWKVLSDSAEKALDRYLANPNIKWGLWELRVGEAQVRLIEEVFTPREPPSEREIEAYYRRHRNEFERQGGFSFRNVFFDTTKCEISACTEELRKKAEETYSALVRSVTREDGTLPEHRFLQIASQTTGRPASDFEVKGEYRFGRINPALERAAMSLEEGQISGVVQTHHGFHILWLAEKKHPKTITMSEARKSIVDAVLTGNSRRNHVKFIQRVVEPSRWTIHEEAWPELIKWASGESHEKSAPFVTIGDFEVDVEEYVNFLWFVRSPLRRMAPAGYIEFRKSHAAFIRMHLLQPEILAQEAEERGLTSDATYEERFGIGREYILGRAVFEQLHRMRLDAQGEPTQDEIKRHYHEHLDEYRTTANYRIREIAITVKTWHNLVEKEFAFREAEEKARAAKAELTAGSPELEVIRSRSDGLEASQGGLTEWLPGTGRYPEPVWDILLSHPVGEWHPDTFRVRNQVVLLKVEEVIPSEQIPLSDCIGRVANELRKAWSETERNGLREEILKASNFKLHTDAVEKLTPLSEIIR